MKYDLYRKKVLGCWLGKSVGGTLGQPWEGKHPPYELTFYDPVPDEMIPNDDLDLQVAWLQRILEKGLPIDRNLLARAWKDNIKTWPDEYGSCLRNMAHNLMPPMTGAHDANFPDGMGAAIRTEIWACLAPGDPKLAAHFAREDACCDHTGNGIWAAEFLATIESAAFVESDRDTLLDMGLAAIPDDCELAEGIRMVRELWPKLQDRDAVLAEILKRYDTHNFTDVKVNVPIIVLAWLSGGNDFSKCILDAVNCGQDADCTCATLGAILGLIDPDCIDEKWLEPIGHDLVLSMFMTGMAPAGTIDEMSDQIAELCPQVLEYYGSDIKMEGAPEAAAPTNLRLPCETARKLSMTRDAQPRDALVQTSPLDITLQYPETARQAPEEAAEYRLTVRNPLDHAARVSIRLLPPQGWELSGETELNTQQLEPLASAELVFQAKHHIHERRPYSSRLSIEQTVDGVPNSCTTGLLCTMPMLRWRQAGPMPDSCPEAPENAEVVEIENHFLDAAPADERHSLYYHARVQCPHTALMNFVAICRRPVRIWWDGEIVVDHEGGPHPVKPIYRHLHSTAGERRVRRGLHAMTIGINPGDGEAGEVFWALGLDGRRKIPGRWYSDAEFDNPHE